MFLYENEQSESRFNNLSHQKIQFEKNSTKSMKRYLIKWIKYTNNSSALRSYIDDYMKKVSNDLKVSAFSRWYKSRKSEAWYLTIFIGDRKRKLRLANHDTIDDSGFDEYLWLYEYKSMKGVYKGILRFIDNFILEWRKRVTIDNFETYFNLALKKRQEHETILQTKKMMEEKKLEYEEKLKDLLNTHKIYEDSIDYLKEIIELISRQHIEHIEKLLNSAVKTIFYDKDYSIKLEIAEFRNSNCLNILLIENTDEGEIITDIKNNGFGIQSIVGFILQVYFIMYHKLEPILFMDEAMSTLSSQYIPYFKELINALANQYNFHFVLVAHDVRFIDIADYKYEVKDGEVRKV